jgi:NtrC-family two-component system response regulator AlgB
MARLLIVDDEKTIRARLATFLESCGHQVKTAASGEEALAALRSSEPVDIVLTDYRMAAVDGLQLLQRVKGYSPKSAVILMTAYATIENAVAAMKAGAYDYLPKPFSFEQARHMIERALEVQKLRIENRALRDTLDERPLLESSSPAMRRLIDTARQAAASEATILLTGESGTGKNVLARQIHLWSSRAPRQFVVVNCTTLTESLLESELFGHLRCAFTGAINDKPGRLEAADGGTLFLDEIGDLGPVLQTKFLRFVQEQNFERVGGAATIRVDARIIAATNRDLDSEVAARRFREDLYYRLNVITLSVPPLRERREDILPLAQWLLGAAAIRNNRPPLKFSAEAEATLVDYAWPGNIRELRNALERTVVLSREDVVRPQDLPDAIFRLGAAERSLSSGASLEEIEREHMLRVLGESATLEEAAATLGINVTTLWRKRKRYGIE